MLKVKIKFKKVYKIGNFIFEVDWSKEIGSKEVRKLFNLVSATGFQCVGLLAVIQHFLIGLSY